MQGEGGKTETEPSHCLFKGELSMVSDVKKSNCLIVFLDVYGFKAIVGSKDSIDISNNLCEGYAKIYSFLQTQEYIPKLYILSDSIFLCYPIENQTEKLLIVQKCIDDVKNIMGIFLEINLPLRGGIAYGEASYNDTLLVGKAVVKAVEYEGYIPAPLVLLPEREVIENLTGNESGVPPEFKVINTKSGKISGKIIMPFPIENFANAINAKLEKHLRDGPPEVAAAWFYAWEYKEKYLEELKGHDHERS